TICVILCFVYFFFFSSRRRHTRSKRDWSSDVCSSDLPEVIMDGILYCFSLDIDSGDFCGEEQCTEYDTDDDSKSQVACEQYDDYCQNHDERISPGCFCCISE